MTNDPCATHRPLWAIRHSQLDIRHSLHSTFPGVVGERDQCGEAEGKPTVERWPVRMQTRVAINRVRIPVAVNPRVPGPGSSSQG